MKKVFFFALASLALASCSQDEEFAPEKSKGSNRTNTEVLSFSSYTAGNTRATVTTRDTVVKYGFQVSAWYDGSLYFKDNALFENGLAINPDSVITNAFDTESDTYWWPKLSADNQISFFAFNNLNNPAEWADDDCKTIKFTVQDSASTQEDLVIAYAEASAKPELGVQPLNFTHALSKVNFTFKGDDVHYKYTINKIEVIAGGEDDAVMSFAETTELAAGGVDKDQPGTNEQANKVKWAYTQIDGTNAFVDKDGAAQGHLYTYSADTIEVKTDGTKLDSSLMILPQTDSIAIRVYYKVEDRYTGKMIGNCGFMLTDSLGRHEDNANFGKDANGDDLATTPVYGCKTVIVNLNDIESGKNGQFKGFQAGMAYRFTLTLPTDNYIGDDDNDGVADGLDEDGNDLDGDLDKNASEFDQLTPIRFSVTVSDWDNNENEYTTEITIK